MTICYHTTSADNAAAILNDGFEDRCSADPDTGDEVTGVYLADKPLSDGFGLPIGRTAEAYAQTLKVEFSDDFDLDSFATKNQGVWHMPSTVIKQHATVTPLSGDDKGGV